jgi:hypothetical protein
MPLRKFEEIRGELTKLREELQGLQQQEISPPRSLTPKARTRTALLLVQVARTNELIGKINALFWVLGYEWEDVDPGLTAIVQ